mmetsp:Transcript_88359/g.193663  ORF Transcript_88359/g.193663 Transcript_88359/m.193663 type:complete len:288 (+) Transcript_88359:272-1135(+)
MRKEASSRPSTKEKDLCARCRMMAAVYWVPSRLGASEGGDHGLVGVVLVKLLGHLHGSFARKVFGLRISSDGDQCLHSLGVVLLDGRVQRKSVREARCLGRRGGLEAVVLAEAFGLVFGILDLCLLGCLLLDALGLLILFRLPRGFVFGVLFLLFLALRLRLRLRLMLGSLLGLLLLSFAGGTLGLLADLIVFLLSGLQFLVGAQEILGLLSFCSGLHLVIRGEHSASGNVHLDRVGGGVRGSATLALGLTHADRMGWKRRDGGARWGFGRQGGLLLLMMMLRTACT